MSNNMEFCLNELQIARKEFIWMIDHFSLRNLENEKCLESTNFTAMDLDGNKQEWQLKIYPNGDSQESLDHISIYAELNPTYLKKSHSSRSGKTIYYHPGYLHINLSFTIKNNKGVDAFKKDLYKKTYISGKELFGFADFMKKEFLFDPKNEFLSDDRLTILCKINNLKEMQINSEDMPKIIVPGEHSKAEDIAILLEQIHLSDCTIMSADNKEIPANKCILACRSPVFAAMFEHELLESLENKINIPDFDSNVLKQMLNFIYYNESALNYTNIGGELLAAADKYELLRLKVLCERELAQSMSVKNACELLILATLHSAEQLKLYAIEYIRKHEKQVKASDGWELLMEEHLRMLGI